MGRLQPLGEACEIELYGEIARAMRGGEEQAGEEGEVIDEEAEFGLVRRSMRRAMEADGEEDDIGARGDRRLTEEGAAEEADDQAELEEGREPGEE